jgi:transcriptional regulator with XRE-family HTH domain
MTTATSLEREAGTAGMVLAGPTIRRHLLGIELRRLRLARSLRLEDTAARIGVDASTVSRIESGKAPARTSFVHLMLDLYQVDDPSVRSLLTDLAREGQDCVQRVDAIIDEAELLRPVGPAALMTAGLEHLLAVMTGPSVTVRVARLGTIMPVLSLPFTILSFSPHDADIACSAGVGGRVIILKRDTEVRALRSTFAALARTALPPAGSASLIREIAGCYRSGHGADAG